MATHKVMDYTGHSEFAFSKDDVVSLKDAERRFSELTHKGYIAHEPGQDGAPGRLVHKFEPETDIIFSPHLVGG